MFVSSAEAFVAGAIKCASHPKEQNLLSKQIFHLIETFNPFFTNKMVKIAIAGGSGSMFY